MAKIKKNELLKKNNIVLQGKAKDFSNYNFWHYTNIEAAACILSSHSFWVSNLENMNDLDEKDLHKDEKDKIHALCFCNSNTEKIPLWYMYSGLSGEGISLGFTPSIMKNFINSIKEVKDCDTKRILKVGEDVNLQYGWIYYKKYSGTYFFKNKWYDISNKNAEEFEKDNYFIKNYPWEYEKEFRILFKNLTKQPVRRVEVVFPEEIIKNIKIKFAPELKKEEALSRVKELGGFQKYFKEKLTYSELNINMSLYERNITDLKRLIIPLLLDKKHEWNYNEIYETIKKFL